MRPAIAGGAISGRRKRSLSRTGGAETDQQELETPMTPEYQELQVWAVMARLREAQEQLERIDRNSGIDLRSVVDTLEHAIFTLLTGRQ